MTSAHTHAHPVGRLVDGYDPDGEVELEGYAGSLTTYGLVLAGIAAAGSASGHHLAERYDLADIALGGLAVHKFTRLVSRSSVAAPVRAPFTRFEGAAGSGEHVESAREDDGRLRATIGKLITCPFCLGVWVGTAYIAGLNLAPRPTRAWAALFAVTALSDTLQHAYSRLRGD
ncbi:DUF1360 domain-containing protein [Nocardioides marmotae]|uniref:DUF1360 domain-containing protein n=1 Tax=Nocardioides marmotae TaxID=2663857 RepID=A0A6I3JF74_9ACTN|nr:DUF1360 domain-containing protein [Nocardioides marmotae]MCR6033073.1 DUF1360 domain-containing protein [Gordonia jinghuaiqii]MBC9732572.1 DUF1360 domain-containing protein [Nocardioides marmotae]MTB83691.1 DUF1360 domain-containing protein [Nocardioides marmotae]MTB96725.1 DUF1360 domain-containing protein [Nocardioides marmotae]QKE03064.1 DUF1360 domain-containing protein [Nocardioides marmotae]